MHKVLDFAARCLPGGVRRGGRDEHAARFGACGAVRSTTTRTTCSPRTGTTTIRRTRTTISDSAWQAPETGWTRDKEPRPESARFPWVSKLMGPCRAQGLPDRPACPPFKAGRQRRRLAPRRVASPKVAAKPFYRSLPERVNDYSFSSNFICFICTFFGRSQFALLHFGQTLGFSFSRGSHSCPHRQRQPSSITIPISAFFIKPPVVTLLEVYPNNLD